MVKVENIETMGWRKAIKSMRNPMNSWNKMDSYYENENFILGSNDFDLACRLIKAGPEHAKFLRMIHVQMNITGPLYFWKEADQYKISTTTNSCSTMHRIHTKEFTLEDFSLEHLNDFSLNHLNDTIKYLNSMREMFLLDKNKHFWWQMIQLLPSSYNQLRTWDGSMQTVLSILKQRKGHKLDEWEQFRQACFDNIPYCKEFYTAMTGKDE